MTVVLRCELAPVSPRAPVGALLREWMAADLEPDACAAIARAYIADGRFAAGLIDPDRIASGGVVGTEELLFGDRHRAAGKAWAWLLCRPDGNHALTLDAADVPAVAELIRHTAGAESIAEAVELVRALIGADAIDAVTAAMTCDERHGRWSEPSAPGIYRREHASLLIQSERGTVLTDPQGSGLAWTTAEGAYPFDATPPRAHVLITHSHGDHWHLPSILRWVDASEPVEIPRAPAPSLLCIDMAGALDVAAQAHASHPWFSWSTADELRYQILPFYGEQPTRALPLPGALRNWGNCYRFELDGYSLVLLVDSGVDAAGTMVDALRRSVAEHGPIDVVMSCCYEFPEALNPGLPDYFLTVPFDELRTRWRHGRASMTSGPDGVAAACEAAGARFFLPYAHGFTALGLEPASSESKLSERTAVDAVKAALATRRAATEVIEWNPGDVMRWVDGRPQIERVLARS